MTKLHLVSHTHWDREWYQTFQQFRLRLVHLIDGVLDLLDSDPNFRYFTLDGQTIVLDDYLVFRPENEERIRRYVGNGRLVIGPWYILPDEFLVSPEATIRNLLEGARTSAKYGPKMKVGYIPDPFGHIGQMPQILQGFNIDSACVQRGLSDERCEFWWHAPDGSRVFMAYLRDGYGNAAGLPVDDHQHFISEVKRLSASLLQHSSTDRHVLLMHGTDHMEPPLHTSEAVAATQGKLDGDELIHSTLGKYVQVVQSELQRKNIPNVYGELRDGKRSHLLPGVLSARMWIKQRNHHCETTLEKWIEPFSTFASLIPQPVIPPSVLEKHHSIIQQNWRLLMECHPHDSICGCSIDQVHDEMRVRFDMVDQINTELLNQDLTLIASNINSSKFASDQKSVADNMVKPVSALVVFNPHSFPCTDSVDAEVECDTPFEVKDVNGSVIPYQNISTGSQQLINVRLSPRELQQLYVAAHDGRIMGYSIIELKSERITNEVRVIARVSEKMEPNSKAWRLGIEEIETWLSNKEINSFHIQVYSLDNTKITISISDIPALGWKTLFIFPKTPVSTEPVKVAGFAGFFLPLLNLPVAQKWITRQKQVHPPYQLESEFLLVAVNKDGSLQVTEKSNGKTWKGLNTFTDGGDCGDEYNYCPPVVDKYLHPKLQQVTIENGAIRKTMVLTYEMDIPVSLSSDRKSRSKKLGKNTIISKVTLIKGNPRMEIQTTVNNNACDHRLRVHFPAQVAVETAEYDGHFEIVERKVGIPPYDESWVEHPRPEVPQRAFTSIFDGKDRLTIANRGLPEVEVEKLPGGGTGIALTLLRCVGWLSRDDFSNRKGHAGPHLETPGAQMLGSWTINYAVIFDRDTIASRCHAYAFQTPLKTISTGIHTGALDVLGSFINLSTPEFLITAIKNWEGGHGWLVRGYNQSSQDLQVSMKILLPNKKIYIGNLAEEKGKILKSDDKENLSFVARAHEIVTLLIQLG